MVLLTSTYLLVGWSRGGGGPTKRSLRILNAPIRVYPRGRVIWSSKPVIVSTPAYHTTLPPDEAARLYPRWVDAKIALGETARSLRGTTGLEPLAQPGKHLPAGAEVPAVAAEIQKRLKGVERTSYPRAPTWDEAAHRYRTPRTPFRLEELEEAMRRATAARAVRAVGGGGGF